jgi:hypothetical protein
MKIDREQSIVDFGLKPSVVAKLRREGIDTIGQLIAKRPLELLKCPNIGRKSVADITNALANVGLCLGCPDPNAEIAFVNLAETNTSAAELRALIATAARAVREANELAPRWGCAETTIKRLQEEIRHLRRRVRDEHYCFMAACESAAAARRYAEAHEGEIGITSEAVTAMIQRRARESAA